MKLCRPSAIPETLQFQLLSFPSFPANWLSKLVLTSYGSFYFCFPFLSFCSRRDSSSADKFRKNCVPPIYIYIYRRNTIKMHKAMETELSHYTAFRNSVPRHKDVHRLSHRCYMNEHNVCSVTSKPSQSSSRCVLSFKNLSALLNN